MELIWHCVVAIQLICNCQFGLCRTRWVNWQAPWVEKEYDPTRYKAPPPRWHKGYELPKEHESPDWRLEEDPNPPHIKGDFFREEHRAYRLSPSWKMIKPWHKLRPDENIHYSGCYCTTVFKRLTPLAGCAVITTRHVLTTATSTYLILRDRQHYQVLENILGVWYDTNHDTLNSSMYLTPARIHYHPQWHYPEQVNRSHPFSFTFDLSVWASTYTIYGWYFNSNSAQTCLRATSHPWHIGPPTPKGQLLHIIVGFQFMLAYNRKPMPWFKHGVKAWTYTEPCPKVSPMLRHVLTLPPVRKAVAAEKSRQETQQLLFFNRLPKKEEVLNSTEWGWFICIPGDWAKFGVESGAALHRSDVGDTWKYDGLIGLAAFSMKLRSYELTHYFTVLDNYPVLDFLYDAYTGKLPYAWKDKRFQDTKHDAPVLLSNYSLNKDYSKGEQHYYHPIYYW